MTFGTTNILIRKVGAFLPLLYILFTFPSCQSTEVDGPCSWQKHEFRATVDTIIVKGTNGDKSSFYSVQLSFDKSSLSKEPQYLEKLKDVKLTEDLIQSHRIAIGNIYTGEVHEVVDGNCPSPVVSFDQNFNF